MSINEEGWNGWILIPIKNEGYLYWTHYNNGESISSIPAAGNFKGVFWYRLGEMRLYPVRDGTALEKENVDELDVGCKKLRLFIEYPRTECDGQIGLGAIL